MEAMPARIRSTVAVLVLSVLFTLSGPHLIAAQTPAAPVDLPQGPLGEQIGWLLGLLNNGDPADLTVEEIAAHVTPEFLAEVPAAAVVATTAQLARALAPVTIEENSIVTTMDLSATNGRLVIVGESGARVEVSIAIDRESGLISSLLLTPAPTAAPEATPVASPAVVAGLEFVDEDVTFESGPDTIYGSLMTPEGALTAGTGALIISGSGPTDRDGNSGPLTAMNTNLNLAVTLAQAGVTTLRYDKLGSGQTGLGSRSTAEPVGVEVFTQEARDALAFLVAQPQVDPGQVVLVGHSEGALFALLLAQEMTAAGTPPAALILVAPLSIRYLDILDEQVTAQVDAALAAGQLTVDQAETAKAELDAIIAGLRENGALPDSITTPGLAGLFNPANVQFLTGIDTIDPAVIASDLPPDLPVLVLHGEKDEQVMLDQVRQLMAGFTSAGNDQAELVVLPDANHLLKIVEGMPNAAIDYANPDLPFSTDAVAAIERFLAAHALSRS